MGKQIDPNRTMSDYISRREAMAEMIRLQVEDEEAYGCHIPEGFDGDRAAAALWNLPGIPPDPERPQPGRWKNHRYNTFHQSATCERCGKEMNWTGESPKYCPNCGARLELEDPALRL